MKSHRKSIERYTDGLNKANFERIPTRKVKKVKCPKITLDIIFSQMA